MNDGDPPPCSTTTISGPNGSSSSPPPPQPPSAAAAARYKRMSPAQLPISTRSPSLTIPPGLSPTSFLDSPVLLSNFKGEPSPTTGSFFKPHLMHNSLSVPTSFPYSINSPNTLDGSNSNGFEFKPDSGSFPVGGFSFPGSLVPSADLEQQRTGQAMEVQPDCQSQSSDPSVFVKSEAEASYETKSGLVTVGSGVQPENDSTEDSSNETQVPQSEQKGLGSQVTTERTSDDGYNWRKYGQKLVKGSEYPRSYYKCTYPNCEVKKLFERSPDGQITEIIYKGSHDHAKPQPNRRLPAGSMMSSPEEKSERVTVTAQEGNPANTFGQTTQNSEPSRSPELLHCGANDNSGEGCVPQVNRTSDDADDDDPFSKRRRIDIGDMDMSSVVKPIREPRVVVQTVSEVDILDDGYRWRKYGQKVVRGNPNPRSYYKCTHPGCPVRKHVERASHDPKAVITTYEGKHNHEVPTARNSSHDTAPSSTSGMGSRMSSHHEGGKTVSLDLGVGIRSNNVPNQSNHGSFDLGNLPGQPQFSNSNMLLLQPSSSMQMHSYPGYVNGGGMVVYGSRENHSQGHHVIGNQPVIHSSNPYQQNMGRILMGP